MDKVSDPKLNGYEFKPPTEHGCFETFAIFLPTLPVSFEEDVKKPLVSSVLRLCRGR